MPQKKLDNAALAAGTATAYCDDPNQLELPFEDVEDDGFVTVHPDIHKLRAKNETETEK